MSTADFQPARLVARLQGILLPNTGRDGSVANFCFNSIFEFFNRIDPKRTRYPTWGAYPAVAPMGGAAADEARLGM